MRNRAWTAATVTRMARSARSTANTLVGTLRKIYGKGFAAGYPDYETAQ